MKWRAPLQVQRLASIARVAARSFGHRYPASEAPQASPAEVLLASGIFDIEYYSAASGQSFGSPLEAAQHCVRVGMPMSISPNPLLDIASMPREIQLAWRAGRVRRLLGYLRSRKGLAAPYGPLFAPRQLHEDVSTLASHAGGALGHFLATATDSAALPVPIDYWGDAPTLRSARTALIRHVAEVCRQRALAGSRLTSEWDYDREREWVARWSTAPVPEEPTPLVSVITPVRNRPGLVAAAIASVQRQTFDGWELIVIDDGSTDETPQVVSALAKQDPRIKLIKQSATGVCAARNRGLAEASGRYCAFLDSDNEWRSNFLSLILAAMQGEKLDAAYACARLVGQSSKRAQYRAFEGTLEHLLVVNHVDLNTLVTTVDLARQIGGFDEGLRRWVDHDFAIRLARNAHLQMLPFVACDYDNRAEAPDRISTTESESWQFVALGKNWVDWNGVRAGMSSRVHSRVSVVMPTYNDYRMTVRAVRAVLAHANGHDVEVVVVDNGSFREVGSRIVAEFLADHRVRYLRLPRNLNFAIGSNVGFAASTGETVVFLNNDTEVRAGWLPAVLAELSQEGVIGVQPLLLYPDDTIQSAGTIFPAANSLPCHFLVGHPVEDGNHAAGKRFSTVTAAAMAVRASDVAELEGFDPLFVNGMEDIDFCLRGLGRLGGTFRVAANAVVTHYESQTPGRSANITENRRHFMARWRGQLPPPERRHYDDMEMTLAHLAGDGSPIPAPRPIVIRAVPGIVDWKGRLRWGLKLPSIPGPRGDAWGDTHLANSLADSLRALGQEVVSYRHGAHNSKASYLDDVVLGIRGLDVIHPQPGKINVLWVISHPEDIDPSELDGFDLVFAASEIWAKEMTSRCGRHVGVLHQATDSRRLPDDSVPIGDGSEPVFVGGTHERRRRQIVLDALAQGVHVAVHGPGWRGLVPDASLRSEYVSNDELLALYRTHGVVLADHWPDMAAHGFVANRVFDAVAAGARVISDDVPGLTDLFGGAVQVYRSAAELRWLCSPAGRSAFPTDDEMSKIAEAVARDHSFDRRAQELVDAVASCGNGLRPTGS